MVAFVKKSFSDGAGAIKARSSGKSGSWINSPPFDGLNFNGVVEPSKLTDFAERMSFDSQAMTRPLGQDRVNLPAFRGEERRDRRFSVGRFFNESGHVVCGGIFLVVFDPRDLARSPLTRVLPGSRGIDCLAVDLEPPPQCAGLGSPTIFGQA